MGLIDLCNELFFGGLRRGPLCFCPYGHLCNDNLQYEKNSILPYYTSHSKTCHERQRKIFLWCIVIHHNRRSIMKNHLFKKKKKKNR